MFSKLWKRTPPPVPEPPKAFDPRDITRLPVKDRERLEGIRSDFEKVLARDLAVISKLGLPRPVRIKNFEFYSTHHNRMLDYGNREDYYTTRTTYPTFSFPPDLFLSLCMWSGYDPPPYRLYDIDWWPSLCWVNYFVSGDQATVEQARKDFHSKGIAYVAKHYRGVWLNRHPYLAFIYSHYLAEGKTPQGDIPSWMKSVRGWELPPIEKLDISEERADELELRTQMMAALCCREWRPEINSYFKTEMQLSDGKLKIKEKWLLECELPETSCRSDQYTTLQLVTSETTGAKLFKNFLDSIRAIKYPAIFEILGFKGTITFYLSVAFEDLELVQRQLSVHFKELTVTQSASPSKALDNDTRETKVGSVKLTLPYHQLKPISQLQVDPYTLLALTLKKASEESTSRLQIIFAPLSKDALTALQTPITHFQVHDHHKIYTRDYMEERLKQIVKKSPTWLAATRIQSTDTKTYKDITGGFFDQYKTDEAPLALIEGEQWSESSVPNVMWTMLSSDELTGLAHLPTQDIEGMLVKIDPKEKLAPDIYSAGEITIGTVEAQGKRCAVHLPDSVRPRHLYLVGKSGTGKSTLLFNIARQDIERGHGVTVIDPHGDLARGLLDYIPKERVKDTLYIDAADKQHPVGLNPLNAESEEEIELLADDLIVTFRRLSETWGERMDTILRYTAHTLLRVPGSTFLDIQNILQNPAFRERAVAEANFAPLTDYWRHQFPSLPKDAVQPILSRMGKFVLSQTLYGMLGQQRSAINFGDVIRGRKVLLVNLSQGRMGEDTAKLLGSLIVSQLQLAVMRQASLPEDLRVPHNLFCDEFQNFTTSAFEKILTEARKFKLSLTIANQFVSQIPDNVRNAIYGNVGTIVAFQVSDKDANYLRGELGDYEPADVVNLSTERHEALLRPVTCAGDTFKFVTLPRPIGKTSYADEIIKQTKALYSSPPQPRPALAVAPQDEQPPRISDHERFEAMPKGKAATPSDQALAYPTEPSQPQPNPAVLKAVISPAPSAAAPLAAALGQHPAAALPQEFTTAGARILYHLTRAEYLSTEQIKQLCYGHLAESARAPVASRDLKKLIEAKQIHAQSFAGGKVFKISKQTVPTEHNLRVRDLYVKIVKSDFEIAGVNFSAQMGGLNPDLAVEFLGEDGSLIHTFWEYDAGTEGIRELASKVARYQAYRATHRIAFILDTEARKAQALRALSADFIDFAVLSDIDTLHTETFLKAKEKAPHSFFLRAFSLKG